MIIGNPYARAAIRNLMISVIPHNGVVLLCVSRGDATHITRELLLAQIVDAKVDIVSLELDHMIDAMGDIEWHA